MAPAKKAAAKKAEEAPEPEAEPVRSSKRKPDKVNVELRDESDQTAYDVERLVVNYGGRVLDRKGTTFTVEVPLGSDRDPSAARTKLIHGLSADPLIVEVTAA